MTALCNAFGGYAFKVMLFNMVHCKKHISLLFIGSFTVTAGFYKRIAPRQLLDYLGYRHKIAAQSVFKSFFPLSQGAFTKFKKIICGDFGSSGENFCHFCAERCNKACGANRGNMHPSRKNRQGIFRNAAIANIPARLSPVFDTSSSSPFKRNASAPQAAVFLYCKAVWIGMPVFIRQIIRYNAERTEYSVIILNYYLPACIGYQRIKIPFKIFNFSIHPAPRTLN